MTLLDRQALPAAAPPPASTARGPRTWIRDLGLGVRFAVAGGREGWTRTALTVVGVGLGVTLLLLAASVPHMLDARNGREYDRATPNATSDKSVAPSDTAFLRADASTEFHGDPVLGQLLRPLSPKAPAPPGVASIPGPGEMVVSPALRDLLASPDGALLKKRLDFRLVGTVAGAGLLDPGELLFYAGSSTLDAGQGAVRSDSYGHHPKAERFNPLLVALVVLICVVLLMPVSLFIATAVRFGGDRRDRRLAALRLVGADAAMTRRIAAGEALFSAVLGLLAGAVLFLVAREFVGRLRLWGLSAFPGDVAPSPSLTLLIVLAVPTAAVLVTLLAMRSVAIEPLGVVRGAGLRGRRLWWRLLMPVAGLGILSLTETVKETDTTSDPLPIAAGSILVLFGLTALLPWLVEAVVSRLRGGPVPWQLATRRLQLSSGSAARAVSGITVAVAGVIALQMMFGGMQEDFIRVTSPTGGSAQAAGKTGPKVVRPDVTADVLYGDGQLAHRMGEDFRQTRGVAGVLSTVDTYVLAAGTRDAGADTLSTLTVGDCATLRRMAGLPSCRDGDTFLAHAPGKTVEDIIKPGRRINLNSGSAYDGSAEAPWQVPASARTVTAGRDPMGTVHDGILATPGAVDTHRLVGAQTGATILLDHRVPDALEYVRNTAARLDPAMNVRTTQNLERDKQYTSVQTGLLIGGTITMVLIAASMLVSQIEQLRERKRLLSVLVAFGTRRGTLAWSVLWQTAVPVAVGTALAVAGGLALGYAMLRMVAKPVRDWWVFLPYAGAGAALILLVTALSLPPLWRMMRPEGLRTE